MGLSTDVRVIAAELRLLPCVTRVPLKFGAETLTTVTCARVRVRVQDSSGKTGDGWGETPLSVQWVWPSSLSYDERYRALEEFSRMLVHLWSRCEFSGHPIEIGQAFIEGPLRELHVEFNHERDELMPHLAALVCCSAFDIAVHDAYGVLHGRPVYEMYNAEFMTKDLDAFLDPAEGSDVSFGGLYPQSFLASTVPTSLPVWHLVGGKDLLDPSQATGDEPDDGYPVLLEDWIQRDGLDCLKVKLRGDDPEWDFNRLVAVGEIAARHGWIWLSTDFNCTVTDPAYVCNILDRLCADQPSIFASILYVEQPFPHDLDKHRIDVHAVSARKPLFMDESAHDWRLVRLGRELGWTGVALKTCKTQTGALLSLCWAKAHGMTLMVQDLTNPMLAQVPHVLLAAYAETIMGVESNAMQFYPEASSAEAAVHPGLYRRVGGRLDLASIRGPGFGYRSDEIERDLPDPIEAAGF